MQPLMKRPEVLKLLGCSPATLYRWMRDHSFPAPIRLGARTARWRREAVEQWLRDRSQPEGSET